MTNKKNSDLFDLIKSMTANEKRFFKLHFRQGISKDEPSNYLYLFNTLDKQINFSEEEIELRYSKKNKSKNQLAADKSYLYRLLLKSLTRFHENKSTSMTIANCLFEAEILIEKGLFTQVDKIILKAQKLISENDLKTEQLALNKIKIKLAFLSTIDNKKLTQTINYTIDSNLKTLTKMGNLYEFYHLHHRFMHFIREKGESLSINTLTDSNLKSDWGAFFELAENININTTSHAQSPEALEIFHFIRYVSLSISGQADKSYDYIKSNFPPLEDWISKKENWHYFTSVFARISNFIEVCLQSKQFEDAEIALELITNLKATTLLEKSQIFHRTSYLKLKLLLATHKNYESLGLVKEIEAGLISYSEVIHSSKKLMLHYWSARALMFNNHQKEALKKLNLIIDNTSANLRKDIQIQARFLQLMIYIDQGNFLFTESLINSAHYYLSSRDLLKETELVILKVLKKMIKIKDVNKLYAILNSTKAVLSEKKENLIARQFIDDVGILSWMDLKLQQINIRQSKYPSA